MRLPRRQFLPLIAAAAAAPWSAWAQSYPERPVRMIVTYAPGGPTDIIARIVTEHWSRSLGQQFVVENVTGAGGTVGVTRVMRSPPDGYTLLLGNLGTQAASVGLYPNLAYDPRSDFAFIIMAASTPLLVAAKKDLPVKDFREFVAYVKSQPLGGIIIGRMGDRRGRKPAMILSFTIMGLAMTGLALTPSYATVGMAAPLLAVLADGKKLVQESRSRSCD